MRIQTRLQLVRAKGIPTQMKRPTPMMSKLKMCLVEYERKIMVKETE